MIGPNGINSATLAAVTVIDGNVDDIKVLSTTIDGNVDDIPSSAQKQASLECRMSLTQTP